MSLALHAYRLLLRFYPAPHRSLLGHQMAAVFAERLAESHAAGPAGLIRWIASEFAGTCADLGWAWSSRIRHAAGHDQGCDCLPDFRKMRPPWTEAKSYYRLLRAPRH